MTAYYNENEPYAAEWLCNLIREGLIADGHVDTRSIEEVTAADLADYRQCHFFAGIGGWSGALRLAGVPDGTPLWTGSCPCQPFSLAGRQGGFADARHLWPVWQRLIAQCRPAVVLGEQVASAAKWLGLVRSDLEAMDYAVGCIPVEAASAGAYHLRDRYWFVADRERGAGDRRPDQPLGQAQGRTAADRAGEIDMADTDPARPQGRQLLPQRAGQRPARANGVADSAGTRSPDWNGRTLQGISEPEWPPQQSERCGNDGWVVGADGKARRVEPGIRLLAHGVPQRVAKLRAFGNAIDLRPAAAFIRAAL